MPVTHLPRKDLIESINGALTTKSSGLELQPRDYEIMRFILEQKFCSLEAIYFRFFDVRKLETDPLPKNLWTTRQRLSKLRSSCLLKTEKVLSSGKAHFLISPLGHKILTDHVNELISIKPTKQIDFSLYEHDVRITMMRALTESKKKCKIWLSEKWLKTHPVHIEGKYKYRFEKDIRPDAFIVNSKGENMGFELEMARKGRARLEEKIHHYDNLLEVLPHYESGEGWGESKRYKVLDKVWFVTTKPSVMRLLKNVIEKSARNPLCFRVDFYDEVVPEVARNV